MGCCVSAELKTIIPVATPASAGGVLVNIASANATATVNGHVAQNDRERFLWKTLDSVLGLVGCTSDLIQLMIQYFGCVCCPYPEFHLYRQSTFGGDGKTIEDYCGARLITTLMGPPPQFKPNMFEYVIARRHPPLMPRGNCRNCGLSFVHHVETWEPHQNEYVNWTRFYPYLRCPVHTCRDCSQPFVKIGEFQDMCASCGVAAKKHPWYNKARWRFNTNPYVDEIQTALTSGTVRVHRKTVTRTTMVTNSKSGKSYPHTETHQIVDVPATTNDMKSYIAARTKTCAVCKLTFSASESGIQGPSAANDIRALLQHDETKTSMPKRESVETKVPPNAAEIVVNSFLYGDLTSSNFALPVVVGSLQYELCGFCTN